MNDALNSAVAWLASLDHTTVLLVLFLTSGIEMIFLLGLLVPGESVVMLAASLPAGPSGFATVVAVGTAGALCGQLLGYAVGRAFGVRIRDTAPGRRIGAHRFDRAEAYLRDHGGPALAAARFVAVVHAVLPIVAGTVRMPFGRFLAWSALGTLAWVSLFAGLGAASTGIGPPSGATSLFTALGATCLGAVPLATRYARRALLPVLHRHRYLRRPAPAPARPASGCSAPARSAASSSVPARSGPAAGFEPARRVGAMVGSDA